MKKKLMKAIVLAAVVATSTVVNVPMVGTVQEAQAAVGSVLKLNIKRTDKTDVTLTWNGVYGADGYEVYMKAGKGGFKKCATSDTTTATISKLKTNTTYTFKVRAFEKDGKKTKYGSYSKKDSIKLNTTVYLTDMYEGEPDGYIIKLYNDKAFTLCDKAYSKGFAAERTSADGIVYNIEENFSKLTFEWGTSEIDFVGNLIVYGDDEILYNEKNDAGCGPQTVTLDITGVNRLTFSLGKTITGDNSAYSGYSGVGNIKVTYE